MSFKTNYIHSKANSSFQSISKYLNLYFSFVVITFTLLQLTSAEDDVTFASSSSSSSDNNELMFHQIEGKVTPPDPKPADWHWATRILIDGGKKLAFLKVTISDFLPSFSDFKALE